MYYFDNFYDLSSFDFWTSSPYLLRELSSNDNLQTQDQKLEEFFKQKLFENRNGYQGGSSLLSGYADILKTQKLSIQNQVNCLKLLANLSVQISAFEDFKSIGLLELVETFSENDKPEIFFEAWKVLHNLNSRDSSIKYLEWVYPLVPPWKKEEPVLDVVLVHGINGGAAWTWRQHDSKRTNPVLRQSQRQQLMGAGEKDESSECILSDSYSWIWPLDWLQHGISRPFRIIAVNYPAGWRRMSGEDTADLDLYALSEEILKQLKAAGVGSRPIIWISHSMGGLIVKTMLKLEACQAREKEKTPPLDTKSSTRAVIFLSVPHFGTPLASWMCRFTAVFRPSRFIYDLRADCPKLANTHQVFIDLCRRKSIQVLTLNETKPLPVTQNGPMVMFVPSKYGNPEIGAYYEVDASHLDVCKPAERSDKSFRIIEEFIAKIFHSLSS